MIGVKFGNKHSWNDFGMILSSKEISPPQVQKNELKIPVRDGSIDLTTAITDAVKYNDRKITLNFTVIESKWESTISQVQEYLHGQRMQIILDDDSSFYYVGRVEVNKWTSKKKIGTIVIECTVEPFKYDILSSAVDWEWDIFDFEEGIINETGGLIINGTTTITLICRKKRMFPTFTTSANMTVTFEGETFNLTKGTQKVYDIFLVEGNNELTFKGNGTVTIDYVGGSL